MGTYNRRFNVPGQAERKKCPEKEELTLNPVVQLRHVIREYGIFRLQLYLRFSARY
jgi:hypothetical protein